MMRRARDIDVNNMVESEASFGTISHNGITAIVASIIVDGKLHAATGADRREALFNAMRCAYPRLEKMEMTPQAAMSSAWLADDDDDDDDDEAPHALDG